MKSKNFAKNIPFLLHILTYKYQHTIIYFFRLQIDKKKMKTNFQQPLMESVYFSIKSWKEHRKNETFGDQHLEI